MLILNYSIVIYLSNWATQTTSGLILPSLGIIDKSILFLALRIVSFCQESNINALTPSKPLYSFHLATLGWPLFHSSTKSYYLFQNYDTDQLFALQTLIMNHYNLFRYFVSPSSSFPSNHPIYLRYPSS